MYPTPEWFYLVKVYMFRYKKQVEISTYSIQILSIIVETSLFKWLW